MVYTNTSVFDSKVYQGVFANKEIKHIWSDEVLVSSWLEFEIALAKAQAELSFIPEKAAKSIEKVCNINNIDWDKLGNDTATNGMAIKPLIDQLTNLGDDLVKKYLHWGGTTQDLLDTSLAMRVAKSLNIIRHQLVQLGQNLDKMANNHINTVMVARTNTMDALPTTWGLHVSGYLQEITRHIQRLDSLYDRAATGTYGGAIGNFSSLGDDALKVRERLFAILSLPEPKGLRNASMDHICELVQFFAVIHGTLCRISNDVENMGRAPIGELREGMKKATSSTMPHKANPRLSNMIQTLSRMGWMYASGAPNLMDQSDIRSASMRTLSWNLVPEASITISTALEKAKELIGNLTVNKQRMQENFLASNNLIMAEAVMMKLAETQGRESSYSMVGDLIKNRKQGQTFKEILEASEDILMAIGSKGIEHALNPENYLGCNKELIDESIAEFRKTIGY